jgi:pyruvate dehydrogenase E1 component beta subunit
LYVEQIINQAANWYFMFEKQGFKMPLVVRMFIGRGWGQGPQHSQSFQSMYAHCPGLKVVMPATPYDAKGLMIAAIEDDSPVIYLEHRWIHNVSGEVPEEYYKIQIGQARIASKGNDVTLVSSSYMTLEALRCAGILAKEGITVEVLDLRTISPLDKDSILNSVKKTGRLVVADPGWKSFGVASEVLALVAEELHGELRSKPVRVTFPDVPLPSSAGLTKYFYPRTVHLVNSIYNILDFPEKSENELGLATDIPFDIPDKSFTGSF